jgi:protein TonB
MFERYMGAKAEKRSKILSVVLTVSLVAHGLGGIALLIWSFWKIEKLVVKDASVLYMAAAMATPPPPPPPPPPPKKSSVKKTDVVKPKNTELVQPNKDQPKPQESSEDEGEDEGVEGGVEGGVAGGVVGGVVGGELGGVEGGVVGSVGAAPPPEPPPQNIPQQAIESQRTAGNAQIQLPAPVLSTLKTQGVQKLQIRTQVCLDASGGIREVSFRKSSGYAEVDSVLKSEIAKWRYRPYLVNGKAVPVCFIVIFNYSIT